MWSPKTIGLHGPQLRVTRVTTQVGMSFPILFNLAVDSVVWHWIPMTVEYNTVIHNSMLHVVVQSLGVFYTDYGIIESQDP